MSRGRLKFLKELSQEAFLDGIRKLYLGKTLLDVRLICKGGEEVFAHKLILCSCSGFFEAYFRSQGNLPVDPNQMTTLDFRHFLAEDIRIILEWIYTGDPPQPQVLAEKIFDIVLISNFLLIDALKMQCFEHFKGVIMEKFILSESTRDPEYPMNLYNLANLIGDRKLMDLARDGFLKSRTLPKDFLKIDVETMKDFLERFDKCTLLVIWRTSAVARELFLLHLVASYINVDKKQRLKDATDLFKLLKLTLIVDRLDFRNLDLEELGDQAAFPELHNDLFSCRIPDQTCLPFSLQNMWLPRKDSIKYSVFTWNRGNVLPLKYSNNGAKIRVLAKDLEVIFGAAFTEKFISEKIAEEPNLGHVVKRFSLENEGAFLIGIDIFTSTSGFNWGLVTGIRFHWSDATSQLAGSDLGRCQSVLIPPPRAATLTIWVASQVVLTAVTVTTWMAQGEGRKDVQSYGPFGEPVGVTREVMVTNKRFESRPYLDGLYGCELDVRGEKLLCSLSFKTSFFVNFPLCHLIGHHTHTPSDHSFDDNDQFIPTTLDILKKTHHVIKVHEFRSIASAVLWSWHYPFCSFMFNTRDRCFSCLRYFVVGDPEFFYSPYESTDLRES